MVSSVDLDDFLQIRDVRLCEIDRSVLLRENDFELIVRDFQKHIAHERRGSVRFHEHRGMIGTKGQIILIMPLLQLGEKLDLLEVVGAVIEFKRHRPFAYLADHVSIACILLPKVLSGLLLSRFPPDRNRPRALFRDSVRRGGRLSCDAISATVWISRLMIWQLYFSVILVGQNTLLIFSWKSSKAPGPLQRRIVREAKLRGNGLPSPVFL